MSTRSGCAPYAPRTTALDIRRSYKRHIVEDAACVVTALQGLGHKVYIISGGLAEPVEEFGIYLGIPRERTAPSA
jgi:phosphoserine phosphatase